MVWQYLLLSCQENQIGFWLHILKGNHFFLWVPMLFLSQKLSNFASLPWKLDNQYCHWVHLKEKQKPKLQILYSSDEWFRLVDIALDRFSLKIVNHKSRLQFCTIKAGKVLYVVASFLGIFIVCHLLIQSLSSLYHNDTFEPLLYYTLF